MDGWVYVLECQNGKLYVGYTANTSRRIAEHFLGLGSMWTKKYKPVRVISRQEGGKPLETAITAQMMVQKGYQNVRGAGFCKVEMNEPEFLQQATALKFKVGDEIEISNSPPPDP